MDIAGLLQRPEGKTLEFKRDLSSPDKVLHTLIAFANTAGGLLVLGIDNGTKHVRGLPDPLREEERLANERRAAQERHRDHYPLPHAP